MIQVDTNILIDIIRNGDAKLVGLLQRYDGAVCGVVRAELLTGVRSPGERVQAMSMLATFGIVPTHESVWDVVGDNIRTLRMHGLTVPFPDAILATLAIAGNVELWTRDAHFTSIQRWLPALKLFLEPS